MADDDEAGCTCRAGMRQVTEVWARQEAGIGRTDDLAAIERQADVERRLAEDARLRAARHEIDPATGTEWVVPDTPVLTLWAKYRAALNTVFPCPNCRPGQFARWRHGCYQIGHQPKRCKMCKDAKAAA